MLGQILIPNPYGFKVKTYQVKNLRTYIGRDKSCDIRVEQRDIAPQHCLIRTTESGFPANVLNLSQSHPTLVNGNLIGGFDVELKNNDILTIGSRKFVWKYIEKPSIDLNPMETFSLKRKRKSEPILKKRLVAVVSPQKSESTAVNSAMQNASLFDEEKDLPPKKRRKTMYNILPSTSGSRIPKDVTPNRRVPETNPKPDLSRKNLDTSKSVLPKKTLINRPNVLTTSNATKNQNIVSRIPLKFNPRKDTSLPNSSSVANCSNRGLKTQIPQLGDKRANSTLPVQNTLKIPKIVIHPPKLTRSNTFTIKSGKNEPLRRVSTGRVSKERIQTNPSSLKFALNDAIAKNKRLSADKRLAISSSPLSANRAFSTRSSQLARTPNAVNTKRLSRSKITEVVKKLSKPLKIHPSSNSSVSSNLEVFQTPVASPAKKLTQSSEKQPADRVERISLRSQIVSSEKKSLEGSPLIKKRGVTSSAVKKPSLKAKRSKRSTLSPKSSSTPTSFVSLNSLSPSASVKRTTTAECSLVETPSKEEGNRLKSPQKLATPDNLEVKVVSKHLDVQSTPPNDGKYKVIMRSSKRKSMRRRIFNKSVSKSQPKDFDTKKVASTSLEVPGNVKETISLRSVSFTEYSGRVTVTSRAPTGRKPQPSADVLTSPRRSRSSAKIEQNLSASKKLESCTTPTGQSTSLTLRKVTPTSVNRKCQSLMEKSTRSLHSSNIESINITGIPSPEKLSESPSTTDRSSLDTSSLGILEITPTSTGEVKNLSSVSCLSTVVSFERQSLQLGTRKVSRSRSDGQIENSSPISSLNHSSTKTVSRKANISTGKGSLSGTPATPSGKRAQSRSIVSSQKNDSTISNPSLVTSLVNESLNESALDKSNNALMPPPSPSTKKIHTPTVKLNGGNISRRRFNESNSFIKMSDNDQMVTSTPRNTTRKSIEIAWNLLTEVRSNRKDVALSTTANKSERSMINEDTSIVIKLDDQSSKHGVKRLKWSDYKSNSDGSFPTRSTRRSASLPSHSSQCIDNTTVALNASRSLQSSNVNNSKTGGGSTVPIKEKSINTYKTVGKPSMISSKTNKSLEKNLTCETPMKSSLGEVKVVDNKKVLARKVYSLSETKLKMNDIKKATTNNKTIESIASVSKRKIIIHSCVSPSVRQKSDETPNARRKHLSFNMSSTRKDVGRMERTPTNVVRKSANFSHLTKAKHRLYSGASKNGVNQKTPAHTFKKNLDALSLEKSKAAAKKLKSEPPKSLDKNKVAALLLCHKKKFSPIKIEKKPSYADVLKKQPPTKPVTKKLYEKLPLKSSIQKTPATLKRVRFTALATPKSGNKINRQKTPKKSKPIEEAIVDDSSPSLEEMDDNENEVPQQDDIFSALYLSRKSTTPLPEVEKPVRRLRSTINKMKTSPPGGAGAKSTRGNQQPQQAAAFSGADYSANVSCIKKNLQLTPEPDYSKNVSGVKNTLNIAPEPDYNANVSAIKKTLQLTPEANYADVSGIKRALQMTPEADYANVSGMKRMLHISPQADYTNVTNVKRNLLTTPPADYTNISGVKGIFALKPLADYSNVTHMKRVFTTSPVANYTDVTGVKQMFTLPPSERSNRRGLKELFPAEGTNYLNVKGVRELFKDPSTSSDQHQGEDNLHVDKPKITRGRRKIVKDENEEGTEARVTRQLRSRTGNVKIESDSTSTSVKKPVQRKVKKNELNTSLENHIVTPTIQNLKDPEVTVKQPRRGRSGNTNVDNKTEASVSKQSNKTVKKEVAKEEITESLADEKSDKVDKKITVKKGKSRKKSEVIEGGEVNRVTRLRSKGAKQTRRSLKYSTSFSRASLISAVTNLKHPNTSKKNVHFNETVYCLQVSTTDVEGAGGANARKTRSKATTSKVTKPKKAARVVKPKAAASVVKPKAAASVVKPKAAASVVKPKAAASVVKPKAATTSVEKPKTAATVKKPKATTSAKKPKATASVEKPKAGKVVNTSKIKSVKKTSLTPKVTSTKVKKRTSKTSRSPKKGSPKIKKGKRKS